MAYSKKMHIGTLKSEFAVPDINNIITDYKMNNAAAPEYLLFWFAAAYNILESIGIPIASYKNIRVFSKEERGDVQGYCINHKNKYDIVISNDTLQHPYTYVVSVIMHELLHTCKDNDYRNNGGHDINFILRAQIVYEKCGIMVFCDDDGTEYSKMPTLHILQCPGCGKLKLFKDPDEKAWQRYLANKGRGINMHCQYCGAVYKTATDLPPGQARRF